LNLIRLEDSNKNYPKKTETIIQEETKQNQGMIIEEEIINLDITVEELEALGVRPNSLEISKNNIIEVEKQNNQIYETLVNNLSDFKSFMEDFHRFIEKTTKDIIRSDDKSGELAMLNNEILTLQEELRLTKEAPDKSASILEKYLSEIIDLKDSINNKDEANKKLKVANKILEEKNKKLILSMQDKFSIMLAEMNIAVAEYVQMPQWKLNPSTKANFQNRLTQTVTTAIQDIINSAKI
jgi:hypothetical protein